MNNEYEKAYQAFLQAQEEEGKKSNRPISAPPVLEVLQPNVFSVPIETAVFSDPRGDEVYERFYNAYPDRANGVPVDSSMPFPSRNSELPRPQDMYVGQPASEAEAGNELERIFRENGPQGSVQRVPPNQQVFYKPFLSKQVSWATDPPLPKSQFGTLCLRR